MPAKGWKKSQDDQMTKKKAAAEVADQIVTTKLSEEITADIPEKKIEEVPAKQLGSGTKDSRNRLPKIIVSTYDKEGNLVVKTYTCTTVRIDEDVTTTLTGGQPTTRKDVMHVALDADVVEVTL